MTTIMNMKNKNIGVSYDESSVQITVSMSAGKDTWTDMSGILTRLFGTETTIMLMSRIINIMSSTIASGNVCNVSMRIPIGSNSYIDIAASRSQLLIKAAGVQVKPHTA